MTWTLPRQVELLTRNVYTFCIWSKGQKCDILDPIPFYDNMIVKEASHTRHTRVETIKCISGLAEHLMHNITVMH